MKHHSFIQPAINWFKENRMVRKVDKIKEAEPERTLYQTMLSALSNNVPNIVDAIENDLDKPYIHSGTSIPNDDPLMKAIFRQIKHKKPAKVNYEYKGTV